MELNANELRKMPKVELHRHLEGSVRFDTITELARYHHLDLGVKSQDELYKKTKVTEPMKNLEEVLAAFETTRQVFCNYESIKRITFENVEDAFRDGVKLLELRFAPVFIAYQRKIAFDEIIEGVIDGIVQGMEQYPVQVGVIHILPRGLDMFRHQDSLDEFLRYRRGPHRGAQWLCGFDLAAAETTTAISEYIPLVESARQAGLGVTVHTGENTDALHVRETIAAYAPQRIGHGIKSSEDPDTLLLLKERNIHLELCPTSNWLTGSVKSLETHPLPELYRAGVSISINSDDPHLMNIDLVDEYVIAHTIFHLTGEQLYQINKQALCHSFLEPDVIRFVEKAHFQ